MATQATSTAFVFDNRGTTYNAWCHVNYTDPATGQAKTWDSGQFGQDIRSASIPAQATNITLEGGAIDGDFFFNPVLGYNPLPGSITTVAFAGSLAAPTYVISQLKLSV
ncbi:MAG TPA: hypothetical protein VGF67_26110 [Ktedonobacteraceae bacterium]